MRRVVTGHTSDGKATIVSDIEVDAITLALSPGAEFFRLWDADETPAFPDNGMPPQQLADIVFRAIKDKKFYVFPSAEFAKPTIHTRMENILQERNPTRFPDLS